MREVEKNPYENGQSVTEATQYCVHGGLKQIKGSLAKNGQSDNDKARTTKMQHFSSSWIKIRTCVEKVKCMEL